MHVLKLPSLSKPIAAESIIYVKAYGNYVWLFATNQPKYLSAKTLKWVENRLPGFIRIHKASLINPNQVARIMISNPQAMSLTMTNGITLPVARRRVEDVRQQLENLAQSHHQG